MFLFLTHGDLKFEHLLMTKLQKLKSLKVTIVSKKQIKLNYQLYAYS